MMMMVASENFSIRVCCWVFPVHTNTHDTEMCRSYLSGWVFRWGRRLSPDAHCLPQYGKVLPDVGTYLTTIFLEGEGEPKRRVEPGSFRLPDADERFQAVLYFFYCVPP